MPALVRDLQIIQRDDEVWFQFRWEGNAGTRLANSEEWHAALDAVKSRIPKEAREWDPEAQVWRVADAFEHELCEIFRNFAGALDAIRSQLGLFGGGAEEAAT